MATATMMLRASPSLQRQPATGALTCPRHFAVRVRQQRCRTVTCKAGKREAGGKNDAWEQEKSQPDTFTQYSGYIAEAAVEEADQLEEYNAERIAKLFNKRPFLLTRRLLQIAGTLGWWAAVRYGATLFGRGDQNFKKRAAQLRSALVQLGPAVSSRPDVVPPEYLEELALLQDRIAPFSTELALQIIEQELGVTVDQLFTKSHLNLSLPLLLDST